MFRHCSWPSPFFHQMTYRRHSSSITVQEPVIIPAWSSISWFLVEPREYINISSKFLCTPMRLDVVNEGRVAAVHLFGQFPSHLPLEILSNAQHKTRMVGQSGTFSKSRIPFSNLTSHSWAVLLAIAPSPYRRQLFRAILTWNKCIAQKVSKRHFFPPGMFTFKEFFEVRIKRTLLNGISNSKQQVRKRAEKKLF